MIIKDIYQVVDLVRTRPRMYLGKSSISRLENFLGGYCLVPFINEGIEFQSTLMPLPFRFFHKYVAYQFDESRNIGWHRIILEQADNDEQKGLDLFFEILDEYRNIEVSRCLRAELTKENIDTVCRYKESLFLKSGDWKSDFTIPMAKRDMKAVRVFVLSKGTVKLLAAEDDCTLHLSWYNDQDDDVLEFLAKIFGVLNWQDIVFDLETVNQKMTNANKSKKMMSVYTARTIS